MNSPLTQQRFHAPACLRAQLAAPLMLVLLVALTDPGAAAWLTTPEGGRLFVRGVCYSPYHPKEGWNLSAATRRRDRRLLEGLSANCLLTWQPVTFEEATVWRKAGMYVIPHLTYSPAVWSVFVDGNDAPVPVYVNAANQRGLRDAARDLASKLKDNPGVLAVSLGNDYAWSALSGNLGFTYGGFDDETVLAFRRRLQARFGTVERYNDLTSKSAGSLADLLPPIDLSPNPLMWEWWLFMRDAFADFLRQGYEGLRAVGWKVPATYSIPCGRTWDPTSERVRLPFLEIVSGNVFYQQQWDWAAFCAEIGRLISAAAGRPVLLTETGAHTLPGEGNLPARFIKQSVACALLHPELAGVGLYEFCDELQLRGKPDEQDSTGPSEYYGLVTGRREIKPTYAAAAEMMNLIKRHERTLQEWQSPPLVWVSQQDVDWWRVGGPEGAFHERIGAALFRLGVSFRYLTAEGMLELDPATQPMFILCDSYLPSNPDGTGDVMGRLIAYVGNGGNLLYISRMPWQRLYGRGSVPQEMQLTPERAPLSRRYGKGTYTCVTSYGLDDSQLQRVLEEYLAEVLSQRAAMTLEPSPKGDRPFWRVMQDRRGLWLLAVNPTSAPLGRLELKPGPTVDPRAITLREADGAMLTWAGRKLILSGLNTYALVFLGEPRAASPAVPVPPSAPTSP